MLPYYALLGIPLIFAIIYELVYEYKLKKYKYKKKNYTIVVFFLIYFLLLAFRDESIGADTVRYIDLYNQISKLSLLDVFKTYGSSDIGYYLSIYLLSTIGVTDRFFIIIVAFITVVPLCYMYYKETNNSLVSISLFIVLPVFQMLFSGLRQAIAMAFVVPCYYYVKKKKLLEFVLTILLAMTFHRSAIILLIMYPAYYWKIKAKHFAYLVPLGGIFYFFNTEIYLLSANFLGGKFAERYASTTETGAYTFLLVFIAFAIYSYFFVNENKVGEEEKNTRNLLIVMIFLQMFAPVNSIAMRMNYYFIIFLPIIIPKITSKIILKDKRLKLLVFFAIYTVFTIYYIDKIGTVDSLNIYPYLFM